MAQLGARFHGMEEVVGSIPTRSTNLQVVTDSGVFSLVAFGWWKLFPALQAHSSPYLNIPRIRAEPFSKLTRFVAKGWYANGALQRSSP